MHTNVLLLFWKGAVFIDVWVHLCVCVCDAGRLELKRQKQRSGVNVFDQYWLTEVKGQQVYKMNIEQN